MKRPEHKRFDYQPRYYKPEKDKSQKFRDRLEIAYRSHLVRKNNSKLLFYFLIISLIIYLLLRFGIL